MRYNRATIQLRKVRILSETKGRRGGLRPGARRPLLTGERMKEYRVTLPPSVADFIRSLGEGPRGQEGNLSDGIRKLAEWYQSGEQNESE